MNNSFFENIVNLISCQPQSETKEKKTKINKIRNEKENVTIDTTEISLGIITNTLRQKKLGEGADF